MELGTNCYPRYFDSWWLFVIAAFRVGFLADPEPLVPYIDSETWMVTEAPGTERRVLEFSQFVATILRFQDSKRDVINTLEHDPKCPSRKHFRTPPQPF